MDEREANPQALTTRLGLSSWQGRIAPVFDVSRNITVVEVLRGIASDRRVGIIETEDPVGRAEQVARLHLGALICGAISRPLWELLSSRGIEVFPFVSGDVEEVMVAYLNGGLQNPALAMPGCVGRRRGWVGRGQGRGRGGPGWEDEGRGGGPAARAGAGWRRGGGRGWRNRFWVTGIPGWMRATAGPPPVGSFSPAPPPDAPSPTRATELEGLRDEAQILQGHLDAIRTRIEELSHK